MHTNPFNLDLQWDRTQSSFVLGPIIAALCWQLRAKVCVEIGVWTGFTTEAFLKNMEAGGVLISCDCDPAAIERAMAIGQQHPHVTLETLCLDSSKHDWTAQRRRHGPFDVALIDGDHGYSGVWEDAQRLAPCMRRGGFMLFHDYAPGQPGVMHAVDRLCLMHQWNKLVLPERVYQGYSKDSYGTAIVQVGAMHP